MFVDVERPSLRLVCGGGPADVVALRDDELGVSRPGELVSGREGRANGALPLRHSSGAALCAYCARRTRRPAGFIRLTFSVHLFIAFPF